MRGAREYAWVPTPEVGEGQRDPADGRARRGRLAGCAATRWPTPRVLGRRGRDLAIPFRAPCDRVMDDSAGPQWTTWFAGGRINLASACVDRWREDPAGRALRPSSARPRTARAAAELARAGDGGGPAGGRAAGGRRAPGRRRRRLPADGPRGRGGRLRRGQVGALYVPVFSGFAAAAIASRLRDAGARVVLAADGGWRRGTRGADAGRAPRGRGRVPGGRALRRAGRLGTGGLRPAAT